MSKVRVNEIEPVSGEDVKVKSIKIGNQSAADSVTHRTISDAKNDNNNNSNRKFISLGDRGGAKFKITTDQNKYNSYPDSAKFIDNFGSMWIIEVNEVINIAWLGAIGNNLFDNSLVLKDAVSLACLTGIPLYIPKGEYVYGGNSPLLITEDFSVYGDGVTSKIQWNSDSGEFDLWDTYLEDGNTIKSVSFENLFILGTHLNNRSDVSAYPLIIRGVDKVSIKNVKIKYSRTMGICIRGAQEVNVESCIVSHCARDGINASNCNFVSLVNNSVSWIDDDALAIHNQVYSEQRDHIVNGNRIKFSQGIKCLGVHNIAITANVLDFIFGGCITVTTSKQDSLEGNNSTFGCVISSNVISNFFNRKVIDNRSTNNHAIYIGSNASKSGTLDSIPGSVKPDGTFDLPYPYYRNIENPTSILTDPIPSSSGIIISNNTIRRDIPKNGMLSDINLGIFWVRDGEVDVDMSDPSSMNGSALFVTDGHIKNLLFQNNIVEGVARVFTLQAGSTLTCANISNNIFYDIEGSLLAQSMNSIEHNIIFKNNIVDLDPYHKSEGRLSNGGWESIGKKTSFLLQGAKGISIISNVFRNVSRISDIDWENAIRDSLIYAQNNIVDQYPVSYNFDSNNLGVGYVSRIGTTICVRQCNPTEENYDQIINYIREESLNQPVSGYYIDKHFVKNLLATPKGSSGSKDIVLGWIRLTTGTNHINGTDWATVKANTNV